MRSSDPPRKSWWWRPNTALRLNFIGSTVGNLLSLLLFLLRTRKLVIDWLIHLFPKGAKYIISTKEGQCAHFVGSRNKWKRRSKPVNLDVPIFLFTDVWDLGIFFWNSTYHWNEKNTKKICFCSCCVCLCVFHVEFVNEYSSNAEQHDSPFFVWKFTVLLK